MSTDRLLPSLTITDAKGSEDNPEEHAGNEPYRSPELYRGRLAPSPTGLMHVGHARTFWTAYQRARDAKGTLVMRMDDLDPERSKSEYVDAAIEDLRWLGIRWQEGPGAAGPDKADRTGNNGPYAPYFQSKRHRLYADAWRNLMRRGLIYPCRCSRKELAALASAPHEGAMAQADDEPIYPGTCRHLSADTAQLPGPTSGKMEPAPANWRFRVPDGAVVEFYDQHMGLQRFTAGVDFGDFLVWRRDNVPSYQLACAVDDATMAITEVVRGADLLKSTARQILLLRALGFAAPSWYHCTLVADHHGQRLAKRYDALSLRALRQRGITPLNIFSAELPILA
ncbi:tRNA glutamyl-Q(34) synthetase GluQRS [Acidicapsa dinghuensis]|uniref:tRNA glutamyl-Q(34) synthetase GluQRS n=1 Tax=Acidicapsa dinghuensis TaxID=2218256 RepID=A0ABW1EIK7_9BACT|nr:tRNA glutamyl-Q(34) synthetase GluQRS [Acidicapsa dinghuensis]